MAGPVKGQFGAEEITLEDAATETTLLKMLSVLQSQNKSKSGGGAASSEKDLMSLAKATGKTTKELEDFEDQIEETSGALSRGFGHVLGAVQGMAYEFMGGSTSISDFSQHITGALGAIPVLGPLVGGSLQLLVGVVDNNIQTFREMSQVGVDFGDSIFGAKLAATQAGLSLETFNGVVSQNSQGLALFAGSAGEGAKRFAQISGQMQKEFGPKFSKLGMTMEETAEYTADYLEMQTSLGRSQRMSNREVVQNAAAMTEQVDLLARVTGKRRDQIMEEIKGNQADKRLKLIFNMMDEGAKKNLNGVLTMLGDASPGMKDAIAEMVATGGVPLNAMGQDLIRLNPNLAKMSVGLKNGTVTQDEFMAEIRKTAEMADNLTDAQKEQYSLLAAQGSEIGAATLEVIGLKNAGKGLSEEQQKQKDAEKSRSKEIADFERIVQEAKNKIMDALITSGLFDTVANILGDFTKFLSSEDGIKKIEGFAKSLSETFSGLLTAFKEGNLMKYVSDLIGTGLSGLGGMIGGVFSKLFGGGETKQEGPPGTSGAGASSGAGAGAGMFVGLDGALEKLAGMVAVGGAVYLAVKGFQVLLRGFAGPQIILGAATLAGLLIGTGAAIALAGKGILSAGDGVEKVASGVERMAAVKDTANLKDIAAALGSLGTAMLKFAGAELISGIGSLFGGDNVFDTMVEGINKFALIDALAIQNVADLAGTGLSDLGDAMIKLAAGGIIDSIGSFFGASSPFEKMVDGINEFANIDATAVQNLTDSSGGLANLKSFADDLNADNVEDFAEAIGKLAIQLAKLNDELSKDNNGFKLGTGVNAGTVLGGAGGGGGVNSNDMLITLMRKQVELTRSILDKTGVGV
jgi:class 3 adenylate cyclase